MTHDAENRALHGDEGALTAARATGAELAVDRIERGPEQVVERVADLRAELVRRIVQASKAGPERTMSVCEETRQSGTDAQTCRRGGTNLRHVCANVEDGTSVAEERDERRVALRDAPEVRDVACERLTLSAVHLMARGKIERHPSSAPCRQCQTGP